MRRRESIENIMDKKIYIWDRKIKINKQKKKFNQLAPQQTFIQFLPLKSLPPEIRFVSFFFFNIASFFRFGYFCFFANDVMGNLERGTNQRLR